MKIENYTSLIRIHNLSGMWLSFFPALFVIALLGSNLLSMLWIPFFFFAAFLARSAGCIINDIADHKFDRKVKRTSDRPIAAGKLAIPETIPLLLILLVGILILLFFLPIEGILLGVLTFLGMIAYPFSKRYFRYPQLILAMVFNTGALFASLAIEKTFHPSAFFIYLACFFWTLYYDTIYGHQDKQYDAILRLHSLSLSKFGSQMWLKKYARIALSFFAFAGILPGLNFLYYIGLAALFLAGEKHTNSIDLDNPDSCGKTFKNMTLVGLFIFFLISLGRL